LARGQPAAAAQGLVGSELLRSGLSSLENLIEVPLDDGDAVRGHLGGELYPTLTRAATRPIRGTRRGLLTGPRGGSVLSRVQRTEPGDCGFVIRCRQG